MTDFFLEYDTGSENLHRVAAKLAGYHNLAARTGITTPVLFWLPTARREAALRALLASTARRRPRGAGRRRGPRRARRHHHTPKPPPAAAGPPGPIWLPAGQPGPRLPLARPRPARHHRPRPQTPATPPPRRRPALASPRPRAASLRHRR